MIFDYWLREAVTSAYRRSRKGSRHTGECAGK